MAAELGVALSTYSLWETGKGEPTGGNVKLVEQFLAAHEPPSHPQAVSWGMLMVLGSAPDFWLDEVVAPATQRICTAYSKSGAARETPASIYWLWDELAQGLYHAEDGPVWKLSRGAKSIINGARDTKENVLITKIRMAVDLTEAFASTCQSAHHLDQVVQTLDNGIVFFTKGMFPRDPEL